MYERFHNLRERPFALTPDPDYLYLSRVHREALSHLRYGIESRAGFVVITGEIGCGKTTLLQTVLRGLDQQTSISRLVHTALDSRELIEAVMLDFGLEPPSGLGKPYLLRDLARFLVDQRNANRLALLVIDEAQNLSESALEEVRMLSNLETEKSKLIQIVLVGQPNLRDRLARPSLEHVRQRVTVSYHLRPMGPDETAAYINHRLRRASIGAPLTFPSGVTDLIYRHTRGVARKVNVVADAILLFGYGANKRAIDIELTQEVLREIGCESTDLGPGAEGPAAPTLAMPTAGGPAQPRMAPPVTSSAPPASAPVEARTIRGGEGAPLASRSNRDTPSANRPVKGAWPPSRTIGDTPMANRSVERAPHPAIPPAAATLGTPRPQASADWLIRPVDAMLAEKAQSAARARASGPGASYTTRGYDVPSDAPARSEGFWARLWRGLLGVPSPAFED